MVKSKNRSEIQTNATRIMNEEQNKQDLFLILKRIREEDNFLSTDDIIEIMKDAWGEENTKLIALKIIN